MDLAALLLILPLENFQQCLGEEGAKPASRHLHEGIDKCISRAAPFPFLPATLLSHTGQLCSVPEDGGKDQARNKVWARSQPKIRVCSPLGNCFPGENQIDCSRWEKRCPATLPRRIRRTLASGMEGAGTPRVPGAGGPREGESASTEHQGCEDILPGHVVLSQAFGLLIGLKVGSQLLDFPGGHPSLRFCRCVNFPPLTAPKDSFHLPYPILPSPLPREPWQKDTLRA